jgi:hypothetical protein
MDSKAKVILIKDASSNFETFTKATLLEVQNKHATQSVEYTIDNSDRVALEPGEKETFVSSVPMTGKINFFYSDKDNIYIKIKKVEIQ